MRLYAFIRILKNIERKEIFFLKKALKSRNDNDVTLVNYRQIRDSLNFFSPILLIFRIVGKTLCYHSNTVISTLRQILIVETNTDLTMINQ